MPEAGNESRLAMHGYGARPYQADHTESAPEYSTRTSEYSLNDESLAIEPVRNQVRPTARSVQQVRNRWLDRERRRKCRLPGTEEGS